MSIYNKANANNVMVIEKQQRLHEPSSTQLLFGLKDYNREQQ